MDELANEIKKQTSADSDPIVSLSWELDPTFVHIYKLTARTRNGKQKQCNVAGTDLITKNSDDLVKGTIGKLRQ